MKGFVKLQAVASLGGPRAQPGQTRGRRFAAASDGVADIVGSILLVAITVVVALAFGLLLLAYDGPERQPHAQLAITMHPGTGGWATGDEELRVQHLGGTPLEADETTIRFEHAGTVTVLTGAGLGSGFADGVLGIGETWSQTITAGVGDAASVQVVSTRESTRLIANTRAVAGAQSGAACIADLLPPSGAWQQEPGNLDSLSSGSVTVTVVLSDNCTGVNGGTAPRLWWCLAATCGPDGFTDGGVMAPAGTNRWTASIPHPGSWFGDAVAGRVLHYYAAPVADIAGNTGQTATRTDTVDLVATHTYAAAANAVTGTVTSLANLQSATDGGAETVLSEGAVSGAPGTGGPTKFSGTVVSQSGASNANNVIASDEARATLATTGGFLELSGISLPAQATGVTAITIGFEGRKDASGGINPTARLDYRLGTGAYNLGSSITVTNSATDADYTRSLPGPFTVADVNAMRVRLFHVLDTNRDIQVDHIFATVTYTTAPAANYRMAIELEWDAVPAGTVQNLELRYRVTSPGDTFSVQVWTGSSWRPCPGTLSATAPTTYVCPLQLPDEALAGEPRIRFTDATPAGTVQGTLRLDWARMATA